MVNLEMQAAQYALLGRGLVVLYKGHINACFPVIVVVVCLHEITALVAEYGRSNHLQTFDRAGLNCNLSHFLLSPL